MIHARRMKAARGTDTRNSSAQAAFALHQTRGMGMVDEVYSAAFYRLQADEVRRNAARAVTDEHREGYLKLAADGTGSPMPLRTQPPTTRTVSHEATHALSRKGVGPAR